MYTIHTLSVLVKTMDVLARYRIRSYIVINENFIYITERDDIKTPPN